MKAALRLEGMEFRGNHGCLDSEKAGLNCFMVDFEATRDISRSAETDKLEDTSDLKKIYDTISREMSRHSDLLENLAWRIADALARNFGELEDIRVTVAKKNPPVGGPVEWSKVTVTL